MSKLEYKLPSGYIAAAELTALQYFYIFFSTYFYLFCWLETKAIKIK